MKSRPTNGQRRMTLLKQTHAATIMYPPYIHVHVHVKCGSDNSVIHCSIQNILIHILDQAITYTLED